MTFNAYINFPEKLDDHINTLEDGKNFLKDFLMTIDLADCETGSELYYSKLNKDSFVGNMTALQEISDLNIGIFDFESILNSLIIENHIFAVRDNDDSGCAISFYNKNSRSVDNEFPTIIYDLVKNNKQGIKDHKQIILNLFGGDFPANPVLLIVDCPEETLPITIPMMKSFVELDAWLQTNWLSRNFNKLDLRHIENSGHHKRDKKSGEYKSPLLGGIGGRTNAETLLKYAQGDKRNTSNKEDLVNYDTVKQEYIWYEYENANNQYHAYHLVKAFTHTRDEIAIKRISDRVIEIIGYRASDNSV